MTRGARTAPGRQPRAARGRRARSGRRRRQLRVRTPLRGPYRPSLPRISAFSAEKSPKLDVERLGKGAIDEKHTRCASPIRRFAKSKQSTAIPRPRSEAISNNFGDFSASFSFNPAAYEREQATEATQAEAGSGSNAGGSEAPPRCERGNLTARKRCRRRRWRQNGGGGTIDAPAAPGRRGTNDARQPTPPVRLQPSEPAYANIAVVR